MEAEGDLVILVVSCAGQPVELWCKFQFYISKLSPDAAS